MTNLQEAALAKAVKAAPKLDVGNHDVDFLVRIKGMLRQGEDYDQRIVAKADPWLLLAVSLSKLNNVTVQAIVREANESDLDSDNIKRQASAAIGELIEPTKTTCKGKLTALLGVEVMADVGEAGARFGEYIQACQGLNRAEAKN